MNKEKLLILKDCFGYQIIYSSCDIKELKKIHFELKNIGLKTFILANRISFFKQNDYLNINI